MSVDIDGLRGKLERAELASELVRALDGNLSVVANSNRTAADRALTLVLPVLEQLRAERDELAATLVRVRVLCEQAQKEADRSFMRDLTGRPFPARVRVADVLAALDITKEAAGE